MLGKIRCFVGDHDYESRADRNDPLNLKDFYSDPTEAFARHTRMYCKRCGRTFPPGDEPCNVSIKI